MPAYLLLRNNIQSGPYSLEELKVSGIRATDLLWVEGRSSAWRYPDEIEELQACVLAAKTNKEAISVSDDSLEIHHEEGEDKKMMAGNQAISLPISKAEKPKGELVKGREDRIVEAIPDNLKITETVSRRTLDIRKSLLAGKENGSASSIIENNKAAHGEDDGSFLKLIKVIIADDHTLFREGVKIALAQKKDIKIVAEAENGAQLLHQLKHNRPDVILLDIQMPVLDGISALVSIRKLYRNMNVIMLSMHDGHSMVSTLMEAGANAYLTKTADPETIYQAIKTCYQKEFYFNELTNVSMLEELRKKHRITDRTASPSFDGAQLMMQLASSQKKSVRHTYKKIKNPILVSGLVGLLIISGVAGLAVLNRPKQFKSASPVVTKKPVAIPSAIPAPVALPPLVNTTDSSPIEANIQVDLQNENSLLKKDKKQIAVKHKQTKSTDSLKAPLSSVTGNSDSSLKANNAVTAKKSTPADEINALAKETIRKLVTASVNDYHKGLFGGLSDIQVTVNNRSTYTMDEVTVEVQYFIAGSKLYKTETLHFQNIAPSSKMMLEAPKSSRGVKIECRIATVQSKDIGL